jgi:glycosyltransferase involved in cell wall biosynthesis
MKRFVAIFPEAENVHLIKDVGMLPYVLFKTLGYESTLVCYKNGEYNYQYTDVKGLRLVFLKRIFNVPSLDIMLFLCFNFWKYDVLQLYHLRRDSLFCLCFFKILTLGKGKSFLKLDAGPLSLKLLRSQVSVSTRCMMSMMDLVSAESKLHVAHFNENNIFGRRISYLPNGFYDGGKREPVPFELKQNKIITVARIGSPEKVNELLCEAFRRFANVNKDWTLELVGPVQESFKPFVTKFFETYPEMKERVLFVGEVTDREVLASYYKSAKLFALTSRSEGFPMVFLESVKYGCYTISTMLPAAFDISAEGRYGRVFPIDDTTALEKIFIDIAADPKFLDERCEEIQDFAYRNYYWPEIAKQIHHLLFKA